MTFTFKHGSFKRNVFCVVLSPRKHEGLRHVILFLTVDHQTWQASTSRLPLLLLKRSPVRTAGPRGAAAGPGARDTPPPSPRVPGAGCRGPPQPPTPHPHPPPAGRPRTEGRGGAAGRGPSRTWATTVRPPWGAAMFTRPWYHAAPAPARATPTTAAATGPELGRARRPAASPPRSLPPQAASRAPPAAAAAAIFAEAPRRRVRVASHSCPKTRARPRCRETQAVSAPPPSPRAVLRAGPRGGAGRSGRVGVGTPPGAAPGSPCRVRGGVSCGARAGRGSRAWGRGRARRLAGWHRAAVAVSREPLSRGA